MDILIILSSNERLRDAISTVKESIDYSISLGHEVIAFTEHETISNHIKIEDYYSKIKKNNPNFKVIRGNEIYLCRDGLDGQNFSKENGDKYFHFILLAKNIEGHKQIREISTRAWIRSYMTGKMRRVPTYYQDLLDIIATNPGNVIGSTACFLPGQKVRTLQGDKNIEDITNKDYILTADGIWEKINFPTNRYYNGNGNILEISKEPQAIKCTENHQFLSYNYKTQKLNWIEAKNLKKQDRILEPIIPIQYSNNTILQISQFARIIEYRQKSIGQNYSKAIYRLPNEIVLTNEIMRLFGLWLADGHINKKESYNKNNVGFTFSVKEFDIFYNSFVKKGLSDLGLTEQDYCINKRLEHNRVDLNINKVEICLLFEELFGISHANNKHIPEQLKHINRDFDIELFFGYFLGDGYFRYRKSQGGEAVAVSISYQLIKDFEQLALSFDLSGGIMISKAHQGKDGVNHQESYYLTYSNTILGKELSKEKEVTHTELINIINLASNKKGSYADFVTLNNVKYRIKKIKSNTSFVINEQVYCLNTNSHNFVLNNVIVHNCLGGFLATKLLQLRTMPEEWQNDFMLKIKGWLKQMEGIFGKGNFFLEMQPSPDKEQIYVNKHILDLSKKLSIPYIITTDTHYIKKEDAPVHKAFLNSQDGEREVDSFYQTTYIMGTEELEEYMNGYMTVEDFQTAYQNILNIKNMCEDYSLKKPLKIPSLKWREPSAVSASLLPKYYEEIPYLKTFAESSYISDAIMARLVVDKLESDERLRNKETYQELNNNLQTTWISSEVNKARWSAYFINLQTTIDVCWEAGTLVGPGRGSGVGFLLLYILDIIQINPLWEQTQCFSWRFLNPERVSILDIDTDIEGRKRASVLRHLKQFYGEDRVANVVTFGTEGSKSAIQTAARGLGLDNDVALYISSLIPADRGKVRTLHQCYYGDKENGFEPISLFVQQMQEYPDLWKVAQRIEGLVSRVGEHAGGVIFVDEPFTESTALMKVPNGDIVTQYDLHDSESVSLIKIDLLSIEALDKMHACLDLLCDYGYAERQATLKETYEKYVGIYNLERTAPEMWDMVHQHKIQALFQMEKQSGIQGIALIKPKSVDELAVLNSVIRLMAPDKNSLTPLEMWARYRKDINLWIQEMRYFGLSEEEIQWLRGHSAITDGICESQEGLMSLVQEPRLGGHSLNFADKCRKALAKKLGSLFDECEQTFFETIEEKHLSSRLADYVWNQLLRVQRGYSFNRSHCLAYSLVGLQEMNLAYRFPIIFWNCACLITDSGGNEEPEEAEIVDIYEPEDFEEFEYEDAPDKKTKLKKKRTRSTDYTKIANAIGKMKQAGIQIEPPNINTSSYTFTPDVENNKIIFGLSGILSVGEDIIQDTIAHRPYSSPKDYLLKVKPKKQSMVSLIKGGAFDDMMDRKLCMAWYIYETCDKKKRLTLQNMPGLLKYNIIPDNTQEMIMGKRIYEFARYLKSICKNDKITYKLDERAISFLTELEKNNLIITKNDEYHLSCKDWDKFYQTKMDVFRDWLTENKEQALVNLNTAIFKEDWDKYAQGTISAWEMEALCFYYHEHELTHLNKARYGLANFFKLPEEPVVEKTFKKGTKEIKLFKLDKIAGTCIAKDKNKSTVSLLTVDGVVNVKMNREYFSMFDKQISEVGDDGKKHRVERSWFTRGSMLLFQGVRSGDNFLPKKYANTGMPHRMYKIDAIDEEGFLTLRTERYQANEA